MKKTLILVLKTEVHKLDIDKLQPVPIDLSRLSNVVKNDVLKKIVYDKLVEKVNNFDTRGFVSKTNYEKDELELEKEIPDTSELVRKTNYNNKIIEIKSKIPSIIGLATNTV